jgi:hypothetical protein
MKRDLNGFLLRRPKARPVPLCACLLEEANPRVTVAAAGVELVTDICQRCVGWLAKVGGRTHLSPPRQLGENGAPRRINPTTEIEPPSGSRAGETGDRLVAQP